MNPPFPSCSRLCLGTVQLAFDHGEGALAFGGPLTAPVVAQFVQELRGRENPVILLPIV